MRPIYKPDICKFIFIINPPAPNAPRFQIVIILIIISIFFFDQLLIFQIDVELKRNDEILVLLSFFLCFYIRLLLGQFFFLTLF